MNPRNDESSAARDKWVDRALGALTLEQKVGQLMVFPFYGHVLTPDVVELIRKHHVGGLRICQKFHPGSGDGRNGRDLKPYEKRSHHPPDALTYDRPPVLQRIGCTPAEYAAALNELRDIALDRPGGIPLHTAFDQEGEGADFLFRQRLFPFPMGFRNSGDPELAYRVARAVGLQARALGGNMIHSPVLDVNTHEANPEIGPRSYSEDPQEVIRYARETLRGFREAGIVATGKHFPGRGASDTDAHFGLPVIDLDGETMRRVHVEPYRALIREGLPAIMAAFTAYPGLGAADTPGATSPAIIRELLREELGFDGVVTTDNIQMGGLLEKYEIGEAVLRCLQAGCDLILCRAYSPVRHHILRTVIRAVREGVYPESALDRSVGRILRMRWTMDLTENGGKVDPDRAGAPFDDPGIRQTAEEAARRTLLLQRDRKAFLPLTTGRRILLVEQAHHFHRFINDSYSHPGMLWQEMRRHSDNVAVVMVEEGVTEGDREAVRRRLDWPDAIVATSYYNYRTGARMLPLLDELKATGKPVVLVTNTPYAAFGAPEEFPAALVCYCPSGRENLRAVAEVLFGKQEPRRAGENAGAGK